MSKKAHRIFSIILVFTLVLTAGIMGYESKKENSVPKLASVTSSADFVKVYDNYEGLIEDADVIAYGTVKKVEAFLGEDEVVHTKIQFEAQEILGGKTADDTLIIIMNGGTIPMADYLKGRSAYMKEKLTPEVFEQMLVNAELNDEMFEYKFNGMENITENSNLLFFLNKSAADVNEYYVTGSSYFGEFKHDISKNVFYRERPKAPNQGLREAGNTQNELAITLDELTEKIELVNHSFTETGIVADNAYEE